MFSSSPHMTSLLYTDQSQRSLCGHLYLREDSRATKVQTQMVKSQKISRSGFLLQRVSSTSYWIAAKTRKNMHALNFNSRKHFDEEKQVLSVPESQSTQPDIFSCTSSSHNLWNRDTTAADTIFHSFLFFFHYWKHGKVQFHTFCNTVSQLSTAVYAMT